MKSRVIRSVAVEATRGAAYSALLMVVMAHGNSAAQVEAAPGMHLHIDQHLVAPFSGQAAPSYRNKPKMFFIQACRGSESGCRTMFSLMSGIDIQIVFCMTSGRVSFMVCSV